MKYKRDAARRGRVEGLLTASEGVRRRQAATIRPIYLTTEHSLLDLRVDLRRGENWRKTLEARERPTTTTLLT